MATTIKAPYPNHKVTTVLPNPQFDDTRASQSTIIIKRTMTGRKVTYTKPSDYYTLTLPFVLTRMKAAELEEFINAYQSAEWHVTLYDGSEWAGKLVGQDITRTATGRIGANDALVGKEIIETTLTLSAKRLN